MRKYGITPYYARDKSYISELYHKYAPDYNYDWLAMLSNLIHRTPVMEKGYHVEGYP